MGREFELKFAADGRKLDAIRADLGGEFHTFAMETAYYDTPDASCAARRWTLRRRLENSVGIVTLKTPLPDGSRGEWECVSETVEAGIERLCELGAPAELRSVAGAGLVQVCAARFTRLAKTVELENAVVELALDRGVLIGGGRELPFAEAEVELKSGSDEAAECYARLLAEKHGLMPEPKSKYVRALALARGL